MARRRLETNRRQRTKRQRVKKTQPHLFLVLFLLDLFVLLSWFLFDCSFFNFPLYLVIMAHSSSYVSVAPDRSRSRDDPPMWSHRTPDRPRNPHHQESWHYTPPLRHTRRVLVIINPELVQHLMTARHSDAMEATTCSTLPSLGRLEQYALFTYSFLVKPAQSQILSVDTMLSTSVSISTTPGALLGTFINGSSLVRLYRRHLCSTQSSDPY